MAIIPHLNHSYPIFPPRAQPEPQSRVPEAAGGGEGVRCGRGLSHAALRSAPWSGRGWTQSRQPHVENAGKSPYRCLTTSVAVLPPHIMFLEVLKVLLHCFVSTRADIVLFYFNVLFLYGINISNLLSVFPPQI